MPDTDFTKVRMGSPAPFLMVYIFHLITAVGQIHKSIRAIENVLLFNMKV